MKTTKVYIEAPNIIIRPNEVGWKLWFEFYRRIGIAPPEFRDTVKVSLAAAKHIFAGRRLAECGVIEGKEAV